MTALVFVEVLRDGKWMEEDAAVLVPGDIISIKLGDIIPADARLLEGDPLKIDQVIKFDDFIEYLHSFYCFPGSFTVLVSQLAVCFDW